jgi:hypothetical protein
LIVNSKLKFWVDTGLFSAFMATFFLELTGLAVHQWIGILVGLITVYHLVTHWNWVKAVTERFFSGTSGQSRRYYLVDAALVAGLAVIISTGLVISSWFKLSQSNYAAWRTIHISASIATLAIIVLKIGLHWRWIAFQFRALFAQAKTNPVPVAASRQPAGARLVTRRELIKIMGVVGVTSFIAMGKSLQSLAQPASGYSNDAASVQANVAASSSSTAAFLAASNTGVNAASSSISSDAASQPASECTIRCSRHCAFPGRCRRYIDTNGNNLCDQGECL